MRLISLGKYSSVYLMKIGVITVIMVVSRMKKPGNSDIFIINPGSILVKWVLEKTLKTTVRRLKIDCSNLHTSFPDIIMQTADLTEVVIHMAPQNETQQEHILATHPNPVIKALLNVLYFIRYRNKYYDNVDV